MDKHTGQIRCKNCGARVIVDTTRRMARCEYCMDSWLLSKGKVEKIKQTLSEKEQFRTDEIIEVEKSTEILDEHDEETRYLLEEAAALAKRLEQAKRKRVKEQNRKSNIAYCICVLVILFLIILAYVILINI